MADRTEGEGYKCAYHYYNINREDNKVTPSPVLPPKKKDMRGPGE